MTDHFIFPDSIDELIEMTSLGTPDGRRHRRNTPPTIEHDVLALIAMSTVQIVEVDGNLDVSAGREGLADQGTDDTLERIRRQQLGGDGQDGELESAHRYLVDRRIVIGDLGGLSVLALALARALRNVGAVTTVVDHPDRSVQAMQANSFDAELYLGLCISPDGGARSGYFESDRLESSSARHLADFVAEALRDLFPDEVATACGMRQPVLTEIRMPAVVCHLNRPDRVVAHCPQLATALAGAVGRWAEYNAFLQEGLASYPQPLSLAFQPDRVARDRRLRLRVERERERLAELQAEYERPLDTRPARPEN
jgi:hypothetical protein